MNEDENFTDKTTAVPQQDSNSASGPLLIADTLPSTLQTEQKQAANQLSEPATNLGHAPTMLAEVVGSQIGPYKLVQQIGEGGMGAVFLAEQQQPVRRMVALKVIKAGMGSAHIIARFEQERQALALMDHPNIAKVLDADKTEAGQPYFVMELVKGIPITKYCEEQRLTIRERLELFVPVCQAIQHAHQKGILHRDIKPSNVLVAVYDGKPVPKVIDFGVAKAIGQKLTEQTLVTGFGGLVGTLTYMSPEQAAFNSVDIDTRSDVYSLGVLLYEMLTGTTPLLWQRLKAAPILEVLRLIRDEEPPRPSTRLSASGDSLPSLSAQRHTEPSALLKVVRGEVDWIVMKALEKDRTCRYETANALARDIQRYLSEEAVEAGPPSARYRLRKLAWRHRRGLATAAVLLLLLVAGIVASTTLAVRAANERNRAQAAEADANEQRDQAKAAEADTKAVLAYFQNKVLSAGRPKDLEGGLGKDVKLRQAVDEATKEIADSFKDRPVVEASIRDTLGQTYLHLGEYSLAIEQHERALALRESRLGADHPDTLISRNNLGQAYDGAGRSADAIRLDEQNLKLCEIKHGPNHRDTLAARNNLAAAYYSAGRIADAILLHEQTLKQNEAQFGADNPDTLIARDDLAIAYRDAGRIADAVRLQEQNLELSEAKLGREHPDTVRYRGSLGMSYQVAGRIDEAIRLGEQVLKEMEAQLGPNHPHTIVSRSGLANAYSSAGRTADAIHLFEQILKQFEAKLSADHLLTIRARGNLAYLYDQAGQFAKAEQFFRATLEQMRKRFGADNANTLTRMSQLALNLLHQHKYTEAEMLFRDCLKIREAQQLDDWTVFYTQSLLGESLLGQKKYADAEPLLLKGYQGMKEREAKIPPQGQLCLTEALQRLVQLYEATGKKDEAARWRGQLQSAMPKADKSKP